MNGGKAPAANAVLIALVGLLVGFIGGYLVGQRGGAGLPSNVPAGGTATADACPHDLDLKDQYILAGFRCPGTDDVQILLLDCHCPTAHGIRDRVKSELAGGKDGNQVRRELIAEYGDRLKFNGQ